MLTGKDYDLFPSDWKQWEQDAATACRHMKITHEELLGLMRRAGARFSRVANNVGWLDADTMLVLNDHQTVEQAFGMQAQRHAEHGGVTLHPEAT